MRSLPRRAPEKGETLTLTFQGAGLTDRSQAIPVHFAIEGEAKGLRVGQLVTVLAPTGEETQGLAVPRTSVLRGANGQTIVFEHTAAERFEPRIVRVEPLDAERVLVLDGLAAGQARGRAGRRAPQPDPLGARHVHLHRHASSQEPDSGAGRGRLCWSCSAR